MWQDESKSLAKSSRKVVFPFAIFGSSENEIDVLQDVFMRNADCRNLYDEMKDEEEAGKEEGRRGIVDLVTPVNYLIAFRPRLRLNRWAKRRSVVKIRRFLR